MSAVSPQPEPDRSIGQFLSVHTCGVIEILRSKGFDVTWRFTKDGSPRFRVNGVPKREMFARQMSERYWDHL